MILPNGVAASAHGSRGRFHHEDCSGPRGPRDIFQRDRDRIIHSVGFRRLRHKTQVFVAPDGDHYRVRLTHSLEVAQIGRTIARALGLNEDLTEALCLAHDLGHPPFGHAGEDALDEALSDAGGFDHNAQTIRILTKLEKSYPEFDGLNLSWEALEGLAKHNGPVAHPSWALAEANAQWDLELGTWPGLEAQVAAISDDIAYDNHDIDDGLRAGLLEIDELTDLPIVKTLWDAIGERHPALSLEKRQRALVRDMIGTMVGDVLGETERRVREGGIETFDDVRSAGRQLARFSDEFAAEERGLKKFLYARLYGLPKLMPVRDEAQRVVAELAAAYRADPDLLPQDWRHAGSEVEQLRNIGDFVAGMTDRFAIAKHEEIIGPVSLPSNRF
jgi:dGTPase